MFAFFSKNHIINNYSNISMLAYINIIEMLMKFYIYIKLCKITSVSVIFPPKRMTKTS